MRSCLYIILSFFIAAAFTACSFTPQDLGKGYMFALNPAEPVAVNQQGQSIAVALPSAAPELDTYRIALIKDNKRWDYYAGARWADFLPLLVQDTLIKTLAGAKGAGKVSDDQSGISTDRLLKIEIRSFQAEYSAGKPNPLIRLHLTAHLQNRIDDTPITNFEVKTEVAAKANRISEIQEAFAEGFKTAQKQLVAKLFAVQP